MDWFPLRKDIPPPTQMERLENELNALKETIEREYETNNESPRYLGLCKRFTNLQTAYDASKQLIEELWDAYNRRHSHESQYEHYVELDAAFDVAEQTILDTLAKANEGLPE
jgi:hypothetical protein